MPCTDRLLPLEGPIRLSLFVLVLLAMLLLEQQWPARKDRAYTRRGAVNAALSIISTLALRLLFPVLAVPHAAAVVSRNGGLFALLPLPHLVKIALAVLALDLAIFGQHWAFHRIRWLWRFHRVHHSDLGFDVTTGFRFHPVEIVLSMLVKLALISALGPQPIAVLLFEILLSIGSLMTHTDVQLPRRVDRVVRWVFVTPTMHRIHHSVRQSETDSNYGFHLALWDRLFQTYTAASQLDELDMPIGIEDFRTARDQSLVELLLQPLRTPASRQ